MPYMNHAIDTTATMRGVAAADMDAPALLAVKIDGDGKFAVPAAGAFCIGIVLATTGSLKAGDELDVQIKDIGYWIAGGTVAKGALLKTDAAGKAVTAAAGDVVCAVALEAGTSGQPMKVMICHTTVPAAASGD